MTTPKYQIIISVYRGVADIEQGDENVEVIIHDYDNCEYDDSLDYCRDR